MISGCGNVRNILSSDQSYSYTEDIVHAVSETSPLNSASAEAQTHICYCSYTQCTNISDKTWAFVINLIILTQKCSSPLVTNPMWSSTRIQCHVSQFILAIPHTHTHTYLNLVQLTCLTPMLEAVLVYNIHFLCHWLIPFLFLYPIQLSCWEQMDWDLL